MGSLRNAVGIPQVLLILVGQNSNTSQSCMSLQDSLLWGDLVEFLPYTCNPYYQQQIQWEYYANLW